MNRRLSGHTYYGPPKIYLLSMCSRNEIEVTEEWTLEWERATLIVVFIDILVVFVFLFGVLRLKFY